MIPGTWNPTIKQGSTWSWTASYLDDAAPIDLTGYTARMDIVHDDTKRTILQLDTDAGGLAIDGVAGTISVTVSAVQTAELDASAHVYDLELVADSDPRSATAEAVAILEGRITVRPQWTKP